MRRPGNTASYLLDGPLEELRPLRPQRYIGSSGVIKPYDYEKQLATYGSRGKKTAKQQPAPAAAAAAARTTPAQ